jgi:precorrin-8X/cobalt-precorrin-8 methylmutase
MSLVSRADSAPVASDATTRVAPIADYSIVVAAHGSRDPAALREVETLIALMKERAPGRTIVHGFLEFARPTIDEAVRSVIERGERRVVLLPALLLAATHAKNDMPGELALLRRQFPEVEFHFGAPADLHPLLLRLAQRRILEAEARAKSAARRVDSCLVVVGRGTSDPDANSEVSKLTRMLEEGLGFGASHVCYAGTAQPSVSEGLRRAARLGCRRLVVFPYFLFDGVLVKRIYTAANELQTAHAELEVLKAGYLGAHEDVAKVFLERACKGVTGRAAMNCSLCKYRVQIVGFEDQVGIPQQLHHLAVRGLSGGSQTPDALSAAASTVTAAETVPSSSRLPYKAHPIEAESFRIIDAGRDWSGMPEAQRRVAQRLVHTSGDLHVVDDLFFSPGAVETGIRALLRCRRVATDVTMVSSGLKRSLLQQLEIDVWCGVHDRETHLLSENAGITRSAAGVRRAWEKWGNEVVLAIGDAPTAILETVRLVREVGWRPQLVIGLPVGFVGTRESKDELRRCLQIPRITNSGTRGGSPWAASVVNALMIGAVDYLAGAWRI